jgi:hypothetical protein
MKWILYAGIAAVAIVVLIVLVGAMLPKGHVVTRSASCRRPPEEVWAVITGDPRWRSDVQGYHPLPPRNGHRTWKELDRRGSGITFEEVDAIPPQRLVVRIADAKLPFGGVWTYVVTPDAGGCTVTITENGEVYNPLFRFVSRFIIGHTASVNAYLNNLRRKFGEG